MVRNSGDLTVLLVEDTEPVRRMIASMLRRNGYAVLETADGAEALEVLTRGLESVHLVLTDVLMPQMSGTDLARHLARLRPGLPVLFMSGYADDPIMQSVPHSAACLLRKPFTAKVLIEAVHQALNGHNTKP
jgi:two-component system, cell cycle sensor histidine kinase and response regulator CckA